MKETAEFHITWPMLAAAMAFCLALVSIVYNRLVAFQRDQKDDIAKVYERFLKEAEQRHALELNLAQNYPKTDVLRATVDRALEPLTIKVDHVVQRVDELRQDLHDYKMEQRA